MTTHEIAANRRYVLRFQGTPWKSLSCYRSEPVDEVRQVCLRNAVSRPADPGNNAPRRFLAGIRASLI